MEVLGRILEALEDALEAFWKLLKASWKRQEIGGALGDLRYHKVYIRVLKTEEARHRI